ncbi:uncharacterized protein LOC143032137 [Oratosquilla oratoria]|uniref:uncharacterized protein LOC143032137 n=1 Tax=Oratosquilla oratoria TaxID=337810 RepID=UPI003F76EABB
MFRFVVAFLAVSAAWAKPSRVLEDELTLELQTAFEKYDPMTIDKVSGIHITTDHSDLNLDANRVIVSDFSKIEVTNFVPAIPGVSSKVHMSIKIPMIDIRTEDYTMQGTHSEGVVDGSGSAYMTFHGVTASLKFDTDSVTFVPLSMCVSRGSTVVILYNESIEGNFDGLDDLNSHISVEMVSIVAGFVDYVNANTNAIEDAVNNALCKK